MRYEDASQSGSSSENPTARDDTDALAAGSRGPATGNVISGAGTMSGAAGADLGAEHSHIVAIKGAHGSDSSASGGKLGVDGQFGHLSIDAEGNYSYLANKGAPENSRDPFTYKLADAHGHSDRATLTIEIGKSPTVVQANAQRVVPGPDGVVVLPAGVELSDVHVVGRNLVIDLPDGTQMLIIDGAVFVPQLVLGDVEVPATSLAALLIGSELRPAAGDEPGALVQSGGGNFEVPVAPLDPGVPLGDLIPPTELGYVPPDFREVALLENAKPTILIQTPDQPAGIENATASVDEAALPARPGEPAGTNSASNAETTTGTIVYTSPDAPNTITVDGVAIIAVGQVIAGDFGNLTITSIINGEIGYSYTLADNTIGDSTSELFTVVITDRDGDQDTATLTISIVDDVPTARPDVDSVSEDGPLVADGNVVSGSGGTDANSTDGVADTPGADGIVVTAIAFGLTAGSLGAPLAGAYGSLVLGADGHYVYTLNNQSGAVQALGVNETLTETFTYTITDGDGDARSTTLTITINGTNDRPTIVSGAANVSEEGLAAGNPDNAGIPTDSTNSATATGQLAIGDIDGDALTVALGTPAGSLTSHGQPISWTVSSDGHVLTGAAGGATVVTVTIANSGAYSVVLSGQVDHPNVNGEDILSFGVPVTVNDGTATASATLTVSVEDDSPVITAGPSVGSSVTIDETDGASPLSSGAPLVVTSSAAIISASVSFGADGPGTATAYSLSLQGGGSSIASGLQTALGDQPITLNLTSASLITATYNGGTQTAFTIQMNANGSITVTQFTALEHLVDGSTPAAFDDALNLVLDGTSLVNATAVFTDYDGDHATGTVAIGAAITFRDDGPSIDVTANGAIEPGIVLTTGDDGTEGAGSTSATTASGNFGGTFGLTFDSGADGAATPSLAFTLNATTAVSGLSSHGVAINLYNVGGAIVGSTALAAPASASDASVVFAVAVNAAGIVTLTQYQQIDHPLQAGANDAPFADQLASLADGAITLTASSTIVDNDGDSASDSATINIGANLHFADDGPAIAATLVQGATIRIDETDGVAAAGGEIDPVGGNLGTVTMAAASLFTVSNTQVSADAPTTNAYALTISAPGVASGLLLSTTNEAIVLVNNGGVIEGHVANPGGAIAFTVAIDAATGATTLTQYLAVEHFDTSSYDEDSSGLTAGVLSVRVTATDYDGDTAVASVDLGSIIRFEDDGPSIDVTADARVEAGVVLTTGDDGTEGAGSTSASTASGNFGGTFGLTFDSGADGAATPSLAFTLNATTAVSGLSSHGVAINLYNVGGTIVGSTALAAPASASDASVVFAVAVNAAGIVTLTQYQQIDHPLQAGANDAPFADQLASLADGAITLTASSTIVDNDGDSASDSATINIGANLHFADDGPAIAATLVQGATIRIDETDGVAAAGGEIDPVGGNLGTVTMAAASLFTVSNTQVSADAPTTNAYALTISAPGVASGLLLSTTNEAIVLVNNGGVIEGHVANPGGAIAFTVAIDAATGATTLTQYLAVEHFDTSSYDEDSSGLTAGVLSVRVTATDYDGDTAVASVDLGSIIRFEDDGPSALNDSASQIGEDANVTINVFANDVPGADGALASSVALVPGSQVGGGTLTNNGDGTFTLDPTPGQTGTVTFNYTITDGDGDVAQATATITLGADSTPSLASTTNLTVDEDGFANANVDASPLQVNPAEVNSTESLTASGTAVVNFGNDVPSNLLGSIALLDTAGLDGQLQLLNGAPVTFALGTGANAGVLIGSAGGTEVIRITITNAVTGPLAGQVTYTYTTALSQPLEHSAGGGENNALLTGVSFQVTDADGDPLPAAGTFNITVVDDVPSALNDSATQVGEDANVTIDVFANDVPGADGALRSSVALVAGSQVGGGTLTNNGDGTFTLDPTPGQTGTVTFNYTITDGDGDVAQATATITLGADSTPSLASTTNLTVDEDGFANANVDASPLQVNPAEVNSTESLTASGTAVVNFGNDVPSNLLGSIALLDTAGLDGQLQLLNGAPVTFALGTGANAGVLIGSAGGTEVIRITITNAVTGPLAGQVTYTYTTALSQPLEHSAGGGENNALLTGVSFQVTDADGDPLPAAGTFNITVVDDVPSALNDSATQVGEDANVTIDVFANDVPGADGALRSSVALVAGSQVGGGTLTNNGDGTFTLDPTPGQTGTVTFNYTITDGDGDVAQATATITLGADSTPSLASTTNLTVDEDGFANANVDASPLQVNPAEVNSTESLTASGTAVVNFGNDVPSNLLGSIALLDTAGLDGQLQLLNGAPVTFALGTGANAGVLIGSAGGTEVIRITITNAVTGPLAGQVTYTYTTALSQPLEHSAGGGENNALLTGVSFQVTDADGDPLPTAGTFNITVVDDVPSASVNAAVATDTLVLDESRPIGSDTDGDSAPAGLATVTTNFANNFTAPIVYGADGGTVAYSLVLSGANVASGLFALQVSDQTTSDLDGIGQGAEIVLNQSGNTITGSVGVTNYFTITIDPTNGDVTFTQSNNVWHSIVASDDDTATLTALANSLLVRQTVTDGDGDVATANIDLSTGVFQIEDDGPSAFTTNAVVTTNGNTPPVHGTFNGFNIGTDGFGQLTFDPALDNQAAMDTGGHNLFIGNQQLFYQVNGNVLTAETSGGAVGFTVTLNQNGSYDFDVNAVISNGTQTSFSNLTSTSAGNVLYRGVGTDNAATPIDVLLSASAGGAPATVNTDNDSVGAANQSVGPNETVRIDFVTLLTSGAATPTGFSYTGHASGTTFSQTIPQVQGNQPEVVSFTVYARDTSLTPAAAPDSNPADGFSDSTQATITSVTVTDYASHATSASFDVTTLAYDTPTAVAFGISVERNTDGSVTFSGVQEGDSYSISTATSFDAIIVEQVSGDFDLGIFTLSGGVAGTPIVQNFGILAIDADGDPQASTITTTINQTAPAAPAAGMSSTLTSVVDTKHVASDVLAPSKIAANDDMLQLRTSSAANSTIVLASAMAAVGLTASPLAAQGVEHGHGGLQVAMTMADSHDNATSALDRAEAHSTQVSEAHALLADVAPAHVAHEQSNGIEARLTAESVHDIHPDHDMASLVTPTEAPVAQVAPEPMPAMIVIPSAEAFEAAEASVRVAGAERPATVERVVAEALHGGHGGGDIDAILAALPGHGGADNPALEALASPHGEAVSAWDTGAAGHLPVDIMTNIVAEMTAFHHDAVQPAVNG